MLKYFGFLICCTFIFGNVASKPLKKPYNYGSCVRDQYRCKNENCIKRSWFCDGFNHCGDNSDESYCNLYFGHACPQHYPFFRCSRNNRCIPKLWQCDGVFDCPDHSDECNCLNDVEKIEGALNAEKKAISWLKAQRRNILGQGKWGNNILRTAVALFLSDKAYFSLGNTTGEEISYEVNAKILARMLRRQHDPLTANELALSVHALLVSCIDPRHYHGMNLVEELRQLADSQENYTSPFVLLALCNADQKMTQTDVNKLVRIAREPQHPFWADNQALTLMALSCIAKKLGPYTVPKFTDVASKLRHLQCKNGSIESVKTTALVMQALIASGEENDDEWDMEQSVKYLIKNQKADGSFGSFLNTYYILPLFRYKSLLNVSSSHCPNKTVDENKVIDDMQDRPGKKVHVTYSLWLGDKVDIARVLKVRVVVNASFFDVMKFAAAVDDRYKFEYSVLNSKPYVYSLSGIQNDPEKDKYWFLYKNNGTDVTPELIDDSPSRVAVHDKEHFIMWYRTGHWNERLHRETEEFSEWLEK